MLRISDSKAKGQFFDYDGEPTECYLELERVQARGKKELRLLSLSGTDCQRHCTDKPNIPAVYPFRNAAVYPSSATRDCFADPRRSRAFWCSDAKIQEHDREFERRRLGIRRLTHTDEYGDVREEILGRCEGSADVRGCLLSRYAETAADIQSAEKNAREAHERDQEAMRTPGDPVEASKAIARLEGVYKKRFRNATAAGERYTSEDVLEIVRVSEVTAFFRLHLEAYNTSTCSLSGLARYSRKGVLVFQDPEAPFDPADEPCILQFEETANEIRLLDPSHACTRLHCGMRGGFHLQAFPVGARRRIQYMDRLKNSRQYRKALEQSKR